MSLSVPIKCLLKVLSKDKKRTGIESYIKMHNLDMKDCYAAGDADNDIEMFELLHENSFCMKAGSQRALDASHYHVEDLAEALEIINGRE